MTIKNHQLVSSLLIKVGGLVGVLIAINFMDRFGGMLWWAAQPLWVNFAPLIGWPLFGFVAGYQIAQWLPAVCPSCGGRARNRRGGEKNAWGYWCSECDEAGNP